MQDAAGRGLREGSASEKRTFVFLLLKVETFPVLLKKIIRNVYWYINANHVILFDCTKLGMVFIIP